MVLFNFIRGLAVVFLFELLDPILARSNLLFHDIIFFYILNLFLHYYFFSFKLMHNLVANFFAISFGLFLQNDRIIWIVQLLSRLRWSHHTEELHLFDSQLLDLLSSQDASDKALNDLG